jgi:hypothetical protein
MRSPLYGLLRTTKPDTQRTGKTTRQVFFQEQVLVTPEPTRTLAQPFQEAPQPRRRRMPFRDDIPQLYFCITFNPLILRINSHPAALSRITNFVF